MTPQYTISTEDKEVCISFKVGERYIRINMLNGFRHNRLRITVEIKTYTWIIYSDVVYGSPLQMSLVHVKFSNYPGKQTFSKMEQIKDETGKYPKLTCSKRNRDAGNYVWEWFLRWLFDPKQKWDGSTNELDVRNMLAAGLLEAQKRAMQDALHELSNAQTKIGKLTGVTHLSTAHAFVCDVTSFPPPFGVPDEHLVRRMNSTHKIGILNLRTNCLFDVAEDEDDALAVFSSNPHIHGSFALIDLTHPAYPTLRVVSC